MCVCVYVSMCVCVHVCVCVCTGYTPHPHVHNALDHTHIRADPGFREGGGSHPSHFTHGVRRTPPATFIPLRLFR